VQRQTNFYYIDSGCVINILTICLPFHRQYFSSSSFTVKSSILTMIANCAVSDISVDLSNCSENLSHSSKSLFS
jgi:hypothetical protein